MGWEKRGAKLVYYRKERGTDGRVRSVYCGSGERGELAAREDAERRSTCGPVEDATHKKKAVADDLSEADGESSETYSPANNPAEAVAHESLPDFRHIKKGETPAGPMTFSDARDHVRLLTEHGMSLKLAAGTLYSQGRVDSPTYLRLLEETP